MNEHASTLVDQWLAGVETKSRATAANYRFAIRRFFSIIDKDVTEITVADAAQYMTDLNRSGLSAGSRAMYVSGVRSFLRWCEVEARVLPANVTPLSTLKRPTVEIGSKHKYLDRENVLRLWEAATPSERVPLGMMFTIGLRVGEVIGAEWRHLYRDPKGRLGLEVHGKGTKVRRVEVPEKVWEALEADRKARGLSTNMNDHDQSPLVARWRTRQGLLAMISRVSRRVTFRDHDGNMIEKKVSPHWGRHSYATLAALAGVSSFQLQIDLGHSRLETTERYVTLAKGLDGAGASVVAGVLFGGRKPKRRRSA